jgi:molybdate transport system regulatory protein
MSKYEIKGKLWMEVDKLHIGKGRARLLEKIKEHGSISKAAQSVEISYRQAWAMIDDMNRTSEKEIVIKSIGGNKGGGTILTKEGENLLKQFQKMESEFQKFQLSFSNELNKKQ